MYDLVSGRKLLKSSYVVGKKKAVELFPMLKKEKLCGAIIYYDGELNSFIFDIYLYMQFPETLTKTPPQYRDINAVNSKWQFKTIPKHCGRSAVHCEGFSNMVLCAHSLPKLPGNIIVI